MEDFVWKTSKCFHEIPYDLSKVKFWCRTCLNTQKHFSSPLSMGGNLELQQPLFGKLDV
jgi:hypothetical protein